MTHDPGVGVAFVMQPRFAALLFTLGLADLAYVNLGLGRELFAEVEAPEPDAEPSPSRQVEPAPEAVPALAPVPERPPPEPNAPTAPSPAPVTRAELVTHESPDTPSPPPAAPPEIEAAPADPTARLAPHAGVARSNFVPPDGAPSELADSTLTVTFPDRASAWLGGRAREQVLALGARLRDRPELRARIIGHADARGTPEFNLNLGGRRARAVSELLARAGVPRQQLEIESRGEAEPRSLGSSERVWAANRRVEINIGTGRDETP
jgi:peptidoglycan-associated lipoprotein